MTSFGEVSETRRKRYANGGVFICNGNSIGRECDERLLAEEGERMNAAAEVISR